MSVTNSVYVWMERSADYADISKLELFLGADERARANKFIYENNRADFIVAHALKRKRIAEIIGVKDLSKLRFAKSDTGKPYLLDADIYFNLSHSSGVTALAISTVSQCGVDIEAHRQVNHLPLLIQKTMTMREKKVIESASSQLKAFFDRWVLKEAFLKLSGIGLAESLRTICTESELVRSQPESGMLRGDTLFFKSGQDYSLAASAHGEAIGFTFKDSPRGYLLSS